MTEERRQLIKRLEECKYKHKEFYKRHPELLEELNSKIYALKNGNEYTIKDANWVICYVGGKIRDTHTGFDDKIVNFKNTMTIEVGKEVYKNIKHIEGDL